MKINLKTPRKGTKEAVGNIKLNNNKKRDVTSDLSHPDLDFNLSKWKHLWRWSQAELTALFTYLFVISSSPDMPENEATFAISAGGVTDAKEWEERRRHWC